MSKIIVVVDDNTITSIYSSDVDIKVEVLDYYRSSFETPLECLEADKEEERLEKEIELMTRIY